MKRAVANVGKTRVLGDVIKENALTTLIKIDPEGLIKVIRHWFMEHGASTTEYRNMLKEYGITKGNIIKRHNLKHQVTIIER